MFVGLFLVGCGGLTPVRYLLVGLGLFVGLAVCGSVRRSLCMFVCFFSFFLSLFPFPWAPARQEFPAGAKEESDSWLLRPRTLRPKSILHELMGGATMKPLRNEVSPARLRTCTLSSALSVYTQFANHFYSSSDFAPRLTR